MPKKVLTTCGMVLLFVWCLWEGNYLISDPDVYWHIETGRHILEHGWPRTDVFSHTVPGQPWIDMEYLAQIIMALVYDAAGWQGLVVLGAILITTTFVLLFYYLEGFLGVHTQADNRAVLEMGDPGTEQRMLAVGGGDRCGRICPSLVRRWQNYLCSSLLLRIAHWAHSRWPAHRPPVPAPMLRQPESLGAGHSRREYPSNAGTWQALSLALVVIWFASFHFIMRPHLFALPILVAWTGELLNSRGREPIYRSQLWLLPLFWLWVQVHGSFVVGVALAAGLGYPILAFLCAGIALANPYGWGYYEMVWWQVTHMDVMRQTIMELRPVSPYTDMTRVGALIAALAFMLWKPYKLSLMSSLTLCGLLFMALQHYRGLAFFAMVAPLIIARAACSPAR